MFSGFYTTDKGHQYIAKAMTGKTLVLTKGQYGTGALQGDTAITAMTSLISPLADMPISKQQTQENCVVTTVQFTNLVNGSILDPFHLMEAGIFGKVKNADGSDDEDSPEVLLFYANERTTEKADYIPATLTEFILNWPLTISEAASVTVEINKSLIYPTMEEFNERVPQKAVTDGTSEALTVTTGDAELTDGMQLSVQLTNGLGKEATLSYNEGEAIPILNANGTPTTENQQEAGTTLNLIYNEKKGCWYILGGGSAEIATKEEAIAGTNDTKMMTPIKVKYYVDEVLGNINTILDTINGKVV